MQKNSSWITEKIQIFKFATEYKKNTAEVVPCGSTSAVFFIKQNAYFLGVPSIK